MEIAVDESGNVIQYGSGIGTPAGCTLVELSDAEAAALAAVLAQPNGGVTFVNGAFAALPAPPSPSPPPNANTVLINHLNTLTLTPGGEADVLRQGVITVLTAQPSVPAV